MPFDRFMSGSKRIGAARRSAFHIIPSFKPPRIDMNKVSEPQLREYDQANAITAAKVVRTAEGFVLVINVNWKEGDLTVYSQRNRPRAWQSVDRLIGHLERITPSIKHFELYLSAGSEPP
jgi:hypothetical protein